MKENEENTSVGQWKPSPTIRDTETLRKELVAKREEMCTWELYRYPTKNKPIKSRSKLRERIESFFRENEGISENITPTRFALYLGYPSERAMMREINNPNPTDPEYSAMLERGLAMIRDRILDELLMSARNDKYGGWKGFQAALEYIDKQDDSTNPKASKAGGVNIAVQVNNNTESQRERISLLIDDSINNLLKSTEAPQKAIDVDSEEVGE